MKKHQKNQKQPENAQPTPQPTAPATPLELSEEELERVTGGCRKAGGEQAPSIGFDGVQTVN